MPRTTFHVPPTLLATTATAALVLATALTAATAPAAEAGTIAQAPKAGTTGATAATSGWTCSVPSGYTYTSSRSSYACSGGSSYRTTEFYAEPPANGLWAGPAPPCPATPTPGS